MSATLAIGQSFRGLYPASNGESLTLRSGTIEKVAESYVVVCVGEKQYRTFKFDKLITRGNLVTITPNNGEIVDGFVRSFSEDTIYIADSKTEQDASKMKAFLLSDIKVERQY